MAGASTGIKLATEAALKEALSAGGSDLSAIERFYTVPRRSTPRRPSRLTS